MRQHRQLRAAHGEPEPLQRPGPLAEQRPGDRLQRAREHHGPPHVRRVRAGRLGEALHRDRVQGALPDLAGEQAEEEALLGLVAAGHQLTDEPGPLRLRAGPGHLAQLGEPGVDLADGEGRLGGRRDPAAQHLSSRRRAGLCGSRPAR